MGLNVSIVVPTLDRGEVLLATVDALSRLEPGCLELLVVDQTRAHSSAVESELVRLDRCRGIRWIRLPEPSIPVAMNRGLAESRADLVLFLDDDVDPSSELLAAHLGAHEARRGEIIAGQVLQPGEVPEDLIGARFAFRSSAAQIVDEAMGGNFSVRRQLALSLGGFDERFVGAAYRFEADFTARARAAGARVWFEPAASVRHLRAPRGGTRSYGSHLRTFWPGHAVGEYYYLFRHRPAGAWRRVLSRPFASVATRHHLRRPWWILPSLCAEFAAIAWAILLAGRGPRLMRDPEAEREGQL